MPLSSSLKPLYPIVLISENSVEEISPENIRVELVGEKAFGLSCLPMFWTLPFIVISDTLLIQCRENDKSITQIIELWKEKILNGLLRVNINDEMSLIVRSSGCAEGLTERGKLYSCSGSYAEFFIQLKNCLENLIADPDLSEDRVPLVVQQYIQVRSAKGHLSNERRCYKEPRDWLGEFEDETLKDSEPFQINIRNWREQTNIEEYAKHRIECNLKVHVSKLLKIPAVWATNQGLRLHYEWVWDGNNIYIVQADQEVNVEGNDPTMIYDNKVYVPLEFMPVCLTEIKIEHTKKFNKIHNVFIYKKLDLPIAKLYILDDQKTIRKLANGERLVDLENDLKALTTTDLIIRMDIDTDDMSIRQLLPRQAVNNFSAAMDWIQKESAEIFSKTNGYDIAFIFHNFIPAVSAAFAYAVPGERKVQIESLWGLPEGLYYNSHDKYVVDTKSTNEEALDVSKFIIDRQPKYKRFFVIPDEKGNWSAKLLSPPYDWKESIQKDEWINEIAYESRRIAKAENEPLSIMWFVGTNKKVHGKHLFPWYHEHFEMGSINRVKSHRVKTPFDKTFTIRTSKDIEKLQDAASNTSANIRRICIQPSEDHLLRSKNTLQDIGILAKRLNAVILLEGGVLSHAYYQLIQTKAIVEIQHPFGHTDEKREFNKLVRDNVPDNIASGGELVNIVKLSGESLLRALRDKLIEESFEVLDATNEEEILEELADVSEVIDGILNQLGVEKEDLLKIQKRKQAKAGGFSEGKVLLDTKNPLPSEKTNTLDTLFEVSRSNTIREVEYKDVIHKKLDKWDDKRIHESSDETIMKLSVPAMRDSWSAKSSEILLDTVPKTKIKLTMTGIREGAKNNIEVSVYTQVKRQLSLFDEIGEN